MNSFSTSYNRKSLESTRILSERSTKLTEKIVECWLRQNHDQYQRLLIQEKQLELALLQQQTVNKNLLKNFNKKKKEIEELEFKLSAIKVQNQKKNAYLHDYYQHLNQKLKSQTSKINLFSKLESLQNDLKAKLQNQKNSLDHAVVRLKADIGNFQQELSFLEAKKQSLKHNLQNLKETKEAFRNEGQRKKLQEKKRKIQQKQQFEALQKQVQKHQEQKDQLEKNEIILKKLLNIEQVHKKHWLIIEKAIKTEFTARFTQRHYKQGVGMQYKLKVPEMESLVSKRKQDVQNLQQELVKTSRKREAARKQLESCNNKFKEVQNQIKAISIS